MKWIALFLLIILSCKAGQPKQDEWIGKTKNELLMQQGVPEQTSSDGQGGQIMVYTHQRVVYGHNRTYKASFFISKDGLIYHVLYDNYETPPEKIDVRIR